MRDKIGKTKIETFFGSERFRALLKVSNKLVCIFKPDYIFIFSKRKKKHKIEIEIEIGKNKTIPTKFSVYVNGIKHINDAILNLKHETDIILPIKFANPPTKKAKETSPKASH